MFFRNRLDARHFKNIEIGNDEKLPNRALPFIWFFARKVKYPILFTGGFYAIGTIMYALEPMFFGQLVEGLTESNKQEVWQNVGIIILGYILLVQLFGRVSFQLGHIIESYNLPHLTMLVRGYLSAYVKKHSYNFFQEDFAGSISGKVIEMPSALKDIVDAMTNGLLYTVVNSLMSVILFSYIHWSLGVVVGIFIICAALIMRWRSPKVYQASAIATQALNVTRGRFIDTISNILLVKLFARERFEGTHFTKCLKDSGTKEQTENMQGVLLWRGYHILCGSFLSVMILLCTYGYQQGFLDISDVAAAFPLAALIIGNLWGLLSMINSLINRFATIQNSLDTVIQNVRVTDSKSAKELAVKKGQITLENIDFSYGNTAVFQQFSLTIPAKQKIGLIGPSGGGKSTLVQLLLRLFDVQKGTIFIDDTNIAKVKQTSLREHISVIPQNNDLLHRSILENIAYGRPDATKEEIITAAKKAYIHDVIMHIEDTNGNKGYDAIVGEKGVKLSGGQRQRIAIARAFLKDAPILILDEATSALDSESERLIQQSLVELMKNKTVIVVAHRLSTIAHLDTIVVLDKGKIVEQGSHQTLLKKNGLYKKLWSLQSEGFLRL